MNQSTMNIFQTYKALVLKKSWEENLQFLRGNLKEIKYKRAWSMKQFARLSLIILGLSLIIMYLILAFSRSDGIHIMDFFMALPLTIVALVFFAWIPLSILLFILASYSFVKVKMNVKYNTKYLSELDEKIKMTDSNIKILSNGLKNHSIVPVEYQVEEQLEWMMAQVKSGVVTSEQDAINLHAYRLERTSNEVKPSMKLQKIKEFLVQFFSSGKKNNT